MARGPWEALGRAPLLPACGCEVEVRMRGCRSPRGGRPTSRVHASGADAAAAAAGPGPGDVTSPRGVC